MWVLGNKSERCIFLKFGMHLNFSIGEKMGKMCILHSKYTVYYNSVEHQMTEQGFLQYIKEYLNLLLCAVYKGQPVI
jgi:hypothetical protein